MTTSDNHRDQIITECSNAIFSNTPAGLEQVIAEFDLAKYKELKTDA